MGGKGFYSPFLSDSIARQGRTAIRTLGMNGSIRLPDSSRKAFIHLRAINCMTLSKKKKAILNMLLGGGKGRERGGENGKGWREVAEPHPTLAGVFSKKA